MYFERVSKPEDAGVNSAVVLDFLNRLDKRGVENHAFVLIKDDKLVIENYTAPFKAHYAHAMFSCSKSLISTAVGLAIEDGKMSLDTPIFKYFPEYAKYAKKDNRNGKITVRQLLTMTSGKKCNFVKDMAKGNFVDDWFKYKFRKDGDFMYSNDDVYMLAAAITRIYGCSVLDFLMPRLLEPMGIDRPFWETTSQGVEAGATGLYLKAMDMAKLAYCYLNGGKYDGKQLIPQKWAEEAGKYLVKLPPYYRASKDYGYFMWGDPHGGYRFDGMYGQWGIIFPKHNAVIAMFDQTCCEQDVIEDIFDCFPRAFEEASDGSAADTLIERLNSTGLAKVAVSERSPLEAKISKYKYKMPLYHGGDISGYTISMLPISINGTFAQRAKRSIDNIVFNFDKDGATMCWTEGKEKNTIKIGLNGDLPESDIVLGTYPFKIVANGVFTDNRTLELCIRAIETPARRLITVKFNKLGASFKFSAVPSVRAFALGHMDEIMGKPKSKLRTKIEDAVLGTAFKIMEPKIHAIKVKNKN